MILGCTGTGPRQMSKKYTDPKSQLIVLAINDDDYYRKYDEKIFNFHVNFAQQVLKHGDQVLIFSTQNKILKYKKALPKAVIVDMPVQDIWMRDFSLSNLINPIKFEYSAAGQGGGKEGALISKEVQSALFEELASANLDFIKTKLINDGGNWVDNEVGQVIISTKFLKDNKLSESAATEKLKSEFNIDAVFIEADEQGGLEHSDGVVSFVEPDKLLVNSYPEDKKYSDSLIAKIKKKFPKIKILELPTPYNGKIIHDSRFGSACGLYTNALVTSKNIYLPQFGIPEDIIALDMVSKFTTKNVVPVISSGVCEMGGGGRCMSWQLAGENKDRLLKLLAPF